MWAFLGSECIFFGSLITTYLVYRGKSVVGPYPDEILNIPLTSISTFVLLMSSLAMVLALAGFERAAGAGADEERKQRELKKGRFWLLMTAVLGTGFLGFQVFEFYEFVHHGLGLTTNLFGTTFYVLTGFHGTHVGVGVIWLVSLLVLSYFGKVKPLDVELGGLYWHFVDIVWIIIFTLIYLIPS
ncbi:MAG: cytochrome oxidase subunit III [Chloroflexi bacterium]|nr:cytochrome oxidase subunit III [Chloroflexota bacterium]